MIICINNVHEITGKQMQVCFRVKEWIDQLNNNNTNEEDKLGLHALIKVKSKWKVKQKQFFFLANIGKQIKIKLIFLATDDE